ncbi:putative Cell cycle serine/threonine-protein kinase CDC5/MSD2 [Blattamonas nauphoetae]|uniref:non-specific serine/threonine protein kinase n=1 Tax=Blattamonas nauphoetae TaxID=2049346 RepID=A0ABQ9XV86_9EUKA|nr:putative Cell cycle serine/threonine-protein kinase CDC5/MSD2 [Blattamonas nauphoetae]
MFSLRLDLVNTILEELGRGSSGLVHRAEKRGQYFAIKQIPRTTNSDDTPVLDEINTMITFQLSATDSNGFDGCVHFIDCFQDENYNYIVMELCDRGTLETEFNRIVSLGEQFTEETLWTIASELSLSLLVLKERRIIHRDIKPANIFIGAKNNLKLGDMGYARQLAHTLDMTVSPVGTPFYAAPEILKNQKYQMECDVWSLGVTLYRLTQQTVPFDGPTKDILFNRIKKAPMPPITVPVSDDLKNLISRMLTKSFSQVDDLIFHTSSPGELKKFTTHIDDVIEEKRIIEWTTVMEWFVEGVIGLDARWKRNDWSSSLTMSDFLIDQSETVRLKAPNSVTSPSVPSSFSDDLIVICRLILTSSDTLSAAECITLPPSVQLIFTNILTSIVSVLVKSGDLVLLPNTTLNHVRFSFFSLVARRTIDF